MSPRGRKHVKTPKIISLLLGMKLKASRPKVQQVLDARPLRSPGILHKKCHAKLSCLGACDYRSVHTPATPESKGCPNYSVCTLPALLTGSALGSQATLDGGFVLHELIHTPDPSQSLAVVPCSDSRALNSLSVSVSCPEADAEPGWVQTQLQQFSLPRSKDSTQGNSGKLDTFWVDTETPKMSYITLEMRPAFRCFLVINGALLPQVHGGDGEESQQGLPGNQDPHA